MLGPPQNASVWRRATAWTRFDSPRQECVFRFFGWRSRSGFAVECNYSMPSRAILTTPCHGPVRIGSARTLRKLVDGLGLREAVWFRWRELVRFGARLAAIHRNRNFHHSCSGRDETVVAARPGPGRRLTVSSARSQLNEAHERITTAFGMERRLVAGPGRTGQLGHRVGAGSPAAPRPTIRAGVSRVEGRRRSQCDRPATSARPRPGAGPRRTPQHPRKRPRLQVRDGQTGADRRHAARLRVHVCQDSQRAGVERAGRRSVFRRICTS